VSVRLGPDRFLCTPSGYSKGLIQPDELIVVDSNVEVVGPSYGPKRYLRPTSDYATPASREGAEVIRDLIKRYDAIVLQRHGSVTVGGSVLEAYLRLEKLEQAAQITKTGHELRRPDPLPQGEVDKLVAWREQQGLLRPGQYEDICVVCGVNHQAEDCGCD